MQDEIEREAVADGVMQMAELVMTEQTVQSVLDLVVQLTLTSVKGADAVAITLLRNERFDTVAMSVPVLAELDDAQIKRGGGPGIQAIRDGAAVVVEDLTSDERWPQFGRIAAKQGFRSVITVPLVPVLEPIGVLALYSAAIQGPDDTTQRMVTLLARQAAIAIANSGSVVHTEQANDQLREALASRDMIGQAKGILMERSDLTADEAFDEMRAESQRSNRKLRDIAEDIVSRVLGRKP